LEQIPAFSMARNSSSVMRCLYGSNRLGRANTGAALPGAMNVVHNAVEGFRWDGAGAQQRRKFLEQLLYLCRELGNGGGGIRGRRG
jgi:hypothetical protein